MTDDKPSMVKKLSTMFADKAFWRSLGLAVMVLVPVGVLGNVASAFIKQDDYRHTAFCMVAAGCQLGVYFYLWPLRSPRRQRQ